VQPLINWAARSEATITNSNELSEAERWIIGRALRRPYRDVPPERRCVRTR
jgi:hypothetical protein